MDMDKKQYQETLRDPVAFHRYILSDPVPTESKPEEDYDGGNRLLHVGQSRRGF
jgi:hypothetical protein